MAITLSNGYVQPETGDKGDVFFPFLEANIQRVNDHSHNGTDSELLTPDSLTITSQTLSSASWVLVGDGTYRQLVTMPGSILFDGRIMQFQINSGGNSGDLFHPSIEKQSANTYYVYINDNTVDVLVKYL